MNISRIAWPLYSLVLALLACHELDAVARHEWRLLPGLSGLNDHDGLIAFVLLHIPAFALLFWANGHPAQSVRWRSQMVVDLFVIVHAIIHFSLNGHPQYEFEPPIETITVFGAAFFGALHALLLIKLRASAPKRD